MMEPVAYLTRFLGTGSAIDATIHKPYLTQPEHYGFEPLVPQSALSDAEARIAELETAIEQMKADHACEVADMATRFRAVNVERLSEQLKVDIFALRDRAEAAGALLKEAGPIIETFAQIGDYVLAEAPAEATMWYAGQSCTGEHMAQVSLDYFRAARAISDKIGVKGE